MNRAISIWILLAFAGCNDSDGTGGGGGDGVLAFASEVRVNAAPGLGSPTDPDICCDGTSVYAVWDDDRNDPGGNEDVFFNRSTDGGLTWSAADIRLDADGPGSGDSDGARICCAGQRIYVTWSDARNGERDIYFNYSTDGGVSWQATDIRLDTDDPGDDVSEEPQICCDGLNVYVAWHDQRDDGGLRANASSDGGATWLANDVRLDTSDDDSEGVSIGCAGARVYAAWRDEGIDEGIHFRMSSDAGQTWVPGTIKLDSGARAVDTPQLCADGLNVYVAWPDDAEEEIFANASLDGGLTWHGERRVTTHAPGTANATNLQICCEGTDVCAAWDNDLDSVLVNRSTDGGATWGVQAVRVDGDPADSSGPVVCREGGSLYVAWRDYRLDPDGDMFFNYSTDGGLTWQLQDIRVETILAPNGTPEDYAIDCTAGIVYVIWNQQPGTSLFLGRAGP